MRHQVNEFDLIIEETLATLNDHQKHHYKLMCAAIISCFAQHDLHGLVIVGRDDPEVPDAIDLAHMISVNTTDIHAVKLVAAGSAQVGTLLMADAPPPELFN